MRYRHCLGLVLFFTLLFVSTHPTLAQDEGADKAPPYPGAWGVQLQLSDVFSDASDVGTRLLVKRMGGSYAGFRLGAGLGVNWSDTDIVDSTGTGGQVQSNAYTFDLSAELLFHPIRDRSVQPYFGFGIVFAYSNLSLDTKPDLDEVSGSATGFGGVLTVGGEWYAVDRLSFYAEYGLQLMSWSSSGEYTPGSGTGEKVDSTQGGLSTRGAVFGMGFYF